MEDQERPLPDHFSSFASSPITMSSPPPPLTSVRSTPPTTTTAVLRARNKRNLVHFILSLPFNLFGLLKENSRKAIIRLCIAMANKLALESDCEDLEMKLDMQTLAKLNQKYQQHPPQSSQKQQQSSLNLSKKSSTSLHSIEKESNNSPHSFTSLDSSSFSVPVALRLRSAAAAAEFVPASKAIVNPSSSTFSSISTQPANSSAANSSTIATPTAIVNPNPASSSSSTNSTSSTKSDSTNNSNDSLPNLHQNQYFHQQPSISNPSDSLYYSRIYTSINTPAVATVTTGNGNAPPGLSRLSGPGVIGEPSAQQQQLLEQHQQQILDNTQNRTIFLGGLSNETTTREICDMVRGGPLEYIRHFPRNSTCFITFISQGHAKKFYDRFNAPSPNSLPRYQLPLKMRKARVGWGSPPSKPLTPSMQAAITNGATRSIYIGNIDLKTATVPDLEREFVVWGIIEQAKIVPELSSAFISFVEISSAIHVVEEFLKHGDDEGRVLNYAKDRCARDWFSGGGQ